MERGQQRTLIMKPQEGRLCRVREGGALITALHRRASIISIPQSWDKEALLLPTVPEDLPAIVIKKNSSIHHHVPPNIVKRSSSSHHHMPSITKKGSSTHNTSFSRRQVPSIVTQKTSSTSRHQHVDVKKSTTSEKPSSRQSFMDCIPGWVYLITVIVIFSGKPQTMTLTCLRS